MVCTGKPGLYGVLPTGNFLPTGNVLPIGNFLESDVKALLIILKGLFFHNENFTYHFSHT